MKRKFLKLIITFFSIIAITINLNPEISLVDSFSGNSVVLFFMFIIFYSFVNNTNKSKKYKNISIIVAIIFSIMYVLGKSIDVFGDIFIFGNKRQVVKLAISLLGYFWIFYNTLKFIFNLSTKKLMQFFDTKKLSALQSKIFSDNITSLLFVALLIFLSWLPIFLQYYPGVVTNDSLNQIYQGVGEHQLTSHHPVIHTLIIGACMRLGILIRDCNLGIAIYSIFQMIAMSTIFSYSLFYMARKKVPVLYRALTLLYFM